MSVASTTSNPTAAPGRKHFSRAFADADNSIVAGENSKLPNAFHNAIDPARYLKREKAIHRLMCQMSVAGYDNKEIAERLDFGVNTVSTVLHQPWAQIFMQQQLQEAGEDMRERIVAEGQAAFARIVDRAKNELAPIAVRQKDDHELVNRYLGKAVQPIEQINKPVEQMTTEELKKQLSSVLDKPRITFDE